MLDEILYLLARTPAPPRLRTTPSIPSRGHLPRRIRPGDCARFRSATFLGKRTRPPRLADSIGRADPLAKTRILATKSRSFRRLVEPSAVNIGRREDRAGARKFFSGVERTTGDLNWT